MAEALLSGVVEGIVGTLTSSVLQEIGLWWGVKDEIPMLRTKVLGVKALLHDAEERQARGEDQVKEWIGELKEVLYDADDLLDDFSTEVLRRQVMTGNKATKEVRLFFSSSNQLAYGLKMGHKIKAIRERLDTVMDVGMKFNFQQRPDNTPTSVMAKKREETHSSVPEIFVGREVDKNEIIQLLLSTSHETNASVISIVGIGGLGKTTLAQLVYNDENVKSQFDLRLWVCVSDDFNVKLIIEKILESITGGKPNMSTLHMLKDSLIERVNGKKYFLVLDDVWNEDSEKWSSLRDLLVCGSKGSQILVTTRSKKVAEITSPVPHARYELMGLSNEESWSLFAQIAFKQRCAPTPSHEAIGKEIVATCKGVPLAIRVIGRLMYFKETILEWESFKSKELTTIDQEKSSIIANLKLSYDFLPSHLKHCFAYCSLFPKDHEIDVDKLVALWMAQGYIKLSDPSQCLEDFGREFFMDLLWRSFFQEVKKDEFGNIISCKMHDLIHDLASLVAGAECVYLPIPSQKEVGKKTRHISFDPHLWRDDHTWQVPIYVLEAKSLRTFFNRDPIFYHETCKGQCQAIFCNLKRLRQLDLQQSSIETVPSSIGKLKHLRYLDLSENEEMKMLPRSITRLQNLQVLKLTGCVGLRQLPKDIKKLVNLRQIDIKYCYALTHMPRGIGRLTSLEKLTRFVLPKSKTSKWKQQENQSGGLDKLHDLNNLGGELSVENLPHYYENEKYNHDKKKGANLREKPRLQELRLQWVPLDWNDIINDNDEERSLEALLPHPNLKKLFVENYGGMKFASWLSSLTNLVKLELYNCPKCRSLPALDQFPSLKEIDIWRLTDLEYIDIEICSSSNSSSNNNNNSMVSFFPSLETLKLKHCPNLKGWRPSSPSSSSSSSLLPQFQCLSELWIASCPNLTSMPPFPSLKELWIVSGSFKTLEQMLKGTISPAAAHDDAPSSSSAIPSNNNNNNNNNLSSSSLNTLRIRFIEDMPEDFLPVELLQTLTSLEDLSISNCPTLTCLPHAKMLLLTSLETLVIGNCFDLNLSNYDDDDESNSNSNNNNNDAILWQGPGLRSLTNLEFASIPKLVHLPRRLLLRSTVLKKLTIDNCPNLESLPEWMPNLTSLQYLDILDCSKLSERCKNNMGEDWPKIAHIPNIEVDLKYIQQNGCYEL